MVIEAEILESEAPVPTPSKITSSEEEGTEASSWVSESEPQLVSPVAVQLTEEPPPTQ